MNIAYLWVALGGAIGSMGRYWAANFIVSRFGESFPLAILFINVTGSLLIGIFAAFTHPDGPMDPRTRAFASQLLMVGICGGYTTFSSFSLQTLQLLQRREWLYACGNVFLSMTLCLIAVWLGYLLGSIFNSPK